MATAGVICSVVQLAQHPPPVQLTMERAALPNPVLSHTPRQRTSRQNHGGFRWHRPAFQPFQLKPWIKDAEMEQEMKETLAVLGPHHVNDFERRPHGTHQRSLTAPATVSSLEARRDPLIHEKRMAPKTAHATGSDIRSLLEPATKRSISTFPARPPLSREKQVFGRFFPKPSLTDDQRVQVDELKQIKDRKAASLPSAAPLRETAATTAERTVAFVSRNAHSETSASMTRLDRQHSPSYNQRIAKTRQQLHGKERHDLKADMFAFSFSTHQGDMSARGGYDPNSELHSDYYSIKRLKMPTASRPGRGLVKTSTDINFAVVLRGHRKHLHKKFLLDAKSTESLVQEEFMDLLQPTIMRSGDGSRGAGDGGDNAINQGAVNGSRPRTLPAELEQSPRKIIDIETPNANGGQADDHSNGSGEEEEEEEEHDHDQTLAPLNSPTTDTMAKDTGAFSALTD